MARNYAYKLGRAEYNKQYRQKKKQELGDYYTAYNLRFRTKNPIPYLLSSAKSRSKKKNLEFNLNPEDLIVPEICPILNIPIFLQAGKGKSPNSPSLHRINPSKGYTKENVIVVSWRANDLLKNGALEEFQKIVEYLKNVRT